MQPKVYFAGPQVFLPNPTEWFDKVRAVCAKLNVKPLIPFDPTLTTPEQIFDANVLLIRQADGMLAWCDPYAGGEPDSGTVWEVGFACALGIRVVLYGDDDRSVAEKQRSFKRGYTDETFGYAHNLMLAHSCTYSETGDIERSLELLLRS